MKRLVWPLRFLVVATVIGSLVAFMPWDLCYAYLAPLSDTVQDDIDNAARRGLDGIIVYVDRKGQLPRLHAAGWKDREAKIAADPHALFKIGSVSKLYMAVAATKLVAAGRLALDDTLVDLLRETAGHIANADRITLRMLIQHRSGLRDFVEDSSFRWDRFGTPDAALSLVIDRPADFEPGSRYVYSNTNYLILGKILDNTLGYSHNAYIQSEILAPLHLTQTYGRFDDVNADAVTSGYDVGHSGDLKRLDFTVPGGSMVATADDVGVFLRALNAGSLLNPSAQSLYASLYTYDHTGLLPGYETIARYHKDIDAVVVVFVSTTGGNSWGRIEAVESRVVRILRK